MQPSAAQYGLVMGIVGGFASLATLAVEIVFIVVVATLVRRERPDAWALLAGSFACDVVALVVGTGGSFAGTMLFGTSGGLYAIAGINLFASVLRVVARALVILGVVRLARPPAARPPWP
jgi:hypothetical protein